MPDGTSQQQVVDGLRQQGDDKQATMLASMEHFVAGQGVDFAAVGHVLLLVLGVYVAASLLAWLQGYLLNDVVQGTVLRMRSDVEDKVNALPLSYFDQQPRGELLSRVTNDIDNISQTLQQTMSQLLTSLLTVVFVVLSMMFWISPAARAGRAGLGADLDGRRRPGDEALAGHVHRPVAAYRQAQRPHRGDVLRPRAGQGVRPPGRGRGDLRRGEREALRGVVRCAVRERADHADDDVHREPQLRRDRGPRRARVANGSMSLGDVQAFIQYSRQFTQPLTQVASMTNLLQSGVASAERVFELLDAPEQDADALGPPADRGRPARRGALRARVVLLRPGSAR